MDKDIRIEIREGGDIAYFFRFSTFFLYARKRMLQQLFWQEFSKTLRLWRRLDFSCGLRCRRFQGRVGVGPYSPSLVLPRYSARAILNKIIVEKNPYFNDLLRGFSIPSRPWSSDIVVSENSFSIFFGMPTKPRFIKLLKYTALTTAARSGARSAATARSLF